jgi:hypothetical protein
MGNDQISQTTVIIYTVKTHTTGGQEYLEKKTISAPGTVNK